jgi:ribose transport system substrate-binding protein
MKAGLSIVAGHSANNNRSLTRSVMRELLRRHPDTKGVFCATDEMALGVVDAVEGLGMAGQVTIVGVDLVEEALDAILDGRLTASVAFSPQDVAAAAMDAVDRKLKGEAAVDDYTVPSRVFT